MLSGFITRSKRRNYHHVQEKRASKFEEGQC